MLKKILAAATAAILFLGIAATPEVGSEIKLVLTANAESGEVPIDEAHFPDAKIRQSVLDSLDKDKNGYLSKEEAAEATSMQCESENITSLKGIEYLTELTLLDCSNNQLEDLDVSKNTKLEFLDCGNNKLKELNVGNCRNLTELYCGNFENEFYKYNNEIVSLDVSKNTKLIRLYCYNNKLEKLGISNNSALEFLLCYNNKLSELDVSNCVSIKDLECEKNQITSLDISSNPLIVDAYNKGYKYDTGDGAISYDYYYGKGDYDRAMLVIDSNVSVITANQQQEAGTADVSGMQNNPNVDVTDMNITFTDDSGKTYNAQVQANGKIMLPSLPVGEYTVTASLENCPSRDYEVTVESGKPVELEVELKLYGDVDGNGLATTADLSLINEQVQMLSELSDYDSKVADVNGDGIVTTSDLSAINEHVQLLELMW